MEDKTIYSEAFRKLEESEAKLNYIITMFWYVIEDYYIPRSKDTYTKANYYDRLETFLCNIHSLLLNTQEDMQNFVENTYEKAKKGEER